MDNMTYAKAIARLEEIMALVQSGKMDIDALTEILKEASSLLQFCKARLFKVDDEVKSLLNELSPEVAE